MAKLNFVTPQVQQKTKNIFQVLSNPNIASYDMIVFCHLRWDFVYQRPQHVISRFARHAKVLFIEEPLAFVESERSSAKLLIINDNLHVLQPRTSSIEDIKDILGEYIKTTKVQVGWFYSPAFIPLLQYFDFDIIVYDCMDELTLFKGASTQLSQQEQQLIAKADIVFTGGKSLFESKSRLHENVYCFPSSVDQQHFSRALDGLQLPKDIARITSPIAGYFGVIDERIDFPLLKATALLNPGISFVMIGPLAKVEEADLPRLDNIHYLGMKPYSELPYYLKAFSVAIMPFSINDATKFISPTKTLEYMAAGKPVISTPVKDVVRDYSHCVDIISTPDEFSVALREALRRSSCAITPAYRKILANTSWDSTVQRMKALVSARVKT